MGRLSREGSIYYHAILFTVFVFLFVTLKNIILPDFLDSPNLTDNQFTASILVFIFMFGVVLATSAMGYRVKTPEHMTLAMFSLVIVSLGLFIIFFNLIWDVVIHSQDPAIGGLGATSMAVSSLLVFVGLVIYINIKFTEEKEQKWFIDAMKETIHRLDAPDYRSYGQKRTARRGRSSRKADARVQYSANQHAEEVTPMDEPQTMPTQAAPSVRRDLPQQPMPQIPQAPNIIKCPGCSVPLKIPDVPTRPLNIRCPHCSAIATVH